MTSQKLLHILNIISENLAEKDIPYSLIGALALGIYGLPRFTADIDLLTEGRYWNQISSMMEKLDYICFQKTDSFAQFDSELGVYGKIDFMLVNTDEGKDILKRSVIINDELWGNHPIIQPTDYIVLKLMAIANNPDRSLRDESDISEVLKLSKNNLIPKDFGLLDMDRIFSFAEKFGQIEKMKRLLNDVDIEPTKTEKNVL
ncbi:MAG: hypothetical protein JW932_04890 [Deltaproteobacteria bacterium]|nr:hypothetical protein [Deltaproteobacteria bacterium]